MSSLNFNFKGLMAPVFTPFNEEKKLKLKIIPDYAKYLHDHGIKGILVNGTVGEGVSMTTSERMEILEEWMKAAEPLDITVMVHVGGTNLEAVKTLARHAESCHVSSILCLADLFFRPKETSELVEYLKLVSREAPNTPLLYYHLPSFTGININMKELMQKSKEIPTFTGIKYTDNDLAMGISCLNINNNTVFLGSDSLLLSALVQGFDSFIGTTINMFPDLNKNVLKYVKEGDLNKAQAEQAKLNSRIAKITQLGPWVSCMKACMRHTTSLEVGPVREPLVNLGRDISNKFNFSTL